MTLNCLGKVVVPTPGTPVPINASIVATASILYIQAIPGLTSKIYVGSQSMNKATLAGVFRILWPNPSGGISDQFLLTDETGLDGLRLAEYYLDADVAGEGALVGYWTE